MAICEEIIAFFKRHINDWTLVHNKKVGEENETQDLHVTEMNSNGIISPNA